MQLRGARQPVKNGNKDDIQWLDIYTSKDVLMLEVKSS